ncbi:MAG: hypothetical protein B7Z73_14275, partial [Planctomycetia bacterium 21-64-5]
MSEHAIEGAASQRGVLAAILGVVLVYLLAALVGWPQHGTQLILRAEHAEGSDEFVAGDHHKPGQGAQPASLPTAV